MRTQRANIPLVKRSYKKFVALGEGINGTDYRMTFEGYPDIEFLVQATQIPPAKRENIDSKGPHGVRFQQQGNAINSDDITVTFKEVIKGMTLAFLRSWVRNKLYLNATLSLVTETNPAGNADSTVLLEGCWLELDPTDLGVEDGAQLVKLSTTMHFNWSSMFDEPSEVGAQSWE